MKEKTENKPRYSRIEILERNLNLKQLQINGLLNITQAINKNLSAEELFKMYNSFLSWEMGIPKMALYVKENEKWVSATSIGVKEELISIDISEKFRDYKRLQNIDEKEHLLLSNFEIVIPIHHKKYSIAYVFIGGLKEDTDLFNVVQFITAISNIIAVAIENKRLFKRQLEQERLKRELELASEMQLMLVPNTLPSGKTYELASIYQPHIGVGGDYYDYFNFDDKFVFCIGDISGKGVGAALLMANFQANLHSLVHSNSDIEQLVHDLNAAIFRITKGDLYLTFFIAIFDEKTRILRYVNAGHPQPFLVQRNGVHRLDEGSTILGSFKKLPSLEVGQIEIADEAMILTYTDGLTDLQDEESNFINEQLLSDFLRNNLSLSAEEFNSQLMERIHIFKGKQEFPDDLTVLTCKFL